MNWENDVAFCPDIGALTMKAVTSLMARNVLASNAAFRDFLEARYRKMAALFRGIPHDDREWEQKTGGCVCPAKHDTSKPDARLVVPVRTIVSRDVRTAKLFDEPNLGLDLPTWFCARNRKKAKRVMLVSQDPLRKGDDAGNLYISSPWAFHSKDFRKKEERTIPHLLVNCLLEHGYCMYLTDASKLFARDCDYCRNTVLPAFGKDFQDVLRQEIKWFKPDVIVAIGKPAAQILTGKAIDDWSELTIPQPSKASVRVEGKEYKCLLSYHFSRLTSRKSALESHYAFTDNSDNRNYIQYYTDAIEDAVR